MGDAIGRRRIVGTLLEDILVELLRKALPSAALVRILARKKNAAHSQVYRGLGSLRQHGLVDFEKQALADDVEARSLAAMSQVVTHGSRMSSHDITSSMQAVMDAQDEVRYALTAIGRAYAETLPRRRALLASVPPKQAQSLEAALLPAWRTILDAMLRLGRPSVRGTIADAAAGAAPDSPARIVVSQRRHRRAAVDLVAH
jgi:DNA-binding PadR family transcriptional regulator